MLHSPGMYFSDMTHPVPLLIEQCLDPSAETTIIPKPTTLVCELTAVVIARVSSHVTAND